MSVPRGATVELYLGRLLLLSSPEIPACLDLPVQYLVKPFFSATFVELCKRRVRQLIIGIMVNIYVKFQGRSVPKKTVTCVWSGFATLLHRKVNAKWKGKHVSSADLFGNLLKANQVTQTSLGGGVRNRIQSYTVIKQCSLIICLGDLGSTRVGEKKKGPKWLLTITWRNTLINYF